MKLLITVFSLAFLLSSCSYFKHKEKCEGDHKTCDANCKHEDGKKCPMHPGTEQVSAEATPAATPVPTPVPAKAPAKKKKK